MRINKLLVILAAALSVCSCDIVDKINGKEIVAKVGNRVLYRTETDNILPKGYSREDSVALVEKYINSWAVNQLMVIKAENELSKQELDVEKQLEEYRNQLLAYKYENLYIQQRLDTVVSENQMIDYYNSHPLMFVTKDGVLRGRMLKISNSSPNLKVVAKYLMSKESVSETGDDELESVVRSSVYVYNNYNNNWIDINVVAKDAGVDSDDMLKSLSKGNIFQFKDSLYTTMVQSLEFVSPGKVAPFEYYRDKIRDIIISKRKQDVESMLQKDILNEALNENKLKIYRNEGN